MEAIAFSLAQGVCHAHQGPPLVWGCLGHHFLEQRPHQLNSVRFLATLALHRVLRNLDAQRHFLLHMQVVRRLCLSGVSSRSVIQLLRQPNNLLQQGKQRFIAPQRAQGGRGTRRHTEISEGAKETARLLVKWAGGTSAKAAARHFSADPGVAAEQLPQRPIWEEPISEDLRHEAEKMVKEFWQWLRDLRSQGQVSEGAKETAELLVEQARQEVKQAPVC